MKLSKLVLTAIFMCGSIAFAQEEDVISETQKEESYIMQCGSQEALGKLVGQDLSTLTDAEKKELQDIRQTTYDVLVGGEEAIKKLLDEGSKNDTGGFGVILACGLIDQMGSRVAEQGCLNFATGETTKGEAGIKACKTVMDNLKAKTK